METNAATTRAELREMLAIPPKSASAIDAGSPGVFDLEGMSETQRSIAMERLRET